MLLTSKAESVNITLDYVIIVIKTQKGMFINRKLMKELENDVEDEWYFLRNDCYFAVNESFNYFIGFLAAFSWNPAYYAADKQVVKICNDVYADTLADN